VGLSAGCSIARYAQRACLALCTLLAACGFRLGYDALEQCGQGGTCPSGLDCVQGLCVLAPDAGGGDGTVVPGTDGGFPSPPGGPTAPLCGSTQLLRDDFTDPAYLWQWVPSGALGASAAVANGRLEIYLDPGAADVEAGQHSRTVYDLRGSEIAVAALQVGGRRTALVARDFTDLRAELSVVDGELRAVVADGASADVRAAVPYSATMHRYWRLRESAGLLWWEVSPDRSIWIPFHAEVTPLRSPYVEVHLVASGQLVTASEVWFDDLNLPSASAPGACAASSVRDTFDDGVLAVTWNNWIGSGACTGREVNGRFELTFSGVGDSWCGTETRQVVDLRDDATVVEVATSPSMTDLSTLFEAVSLADSTRIEMRHDESLLFMSMRDGNRMLASRSLTFDATAHHFWRLREAAGTTYWETSPDATTWTTQLSAPTRIDLSQVIVDLAGGHWPPGPGGPVTIRYDRFNSAP